MRSYVVGDIHGRLELLKGVHALIAEDDAAHGGGGQVVHVGDLIDRGPDSRGVIEYLMRGQAEGCDWVVLKGNHDRFLPRFLRMPDWVDAGLASAWHWLDHPGLGAAPTLASYGVATEGRAHTDIHRDAVAAVPEAHLVWLEQLPLWHLVPQALIVHAGVRPGVDLSRQTEQDLVWIRKGFLEDGTDHGILIVHGHTVVDEVTHFGNRLAVDTGAAYDGPLSAVVLDERGIHVLSEQGRQSVRHMAPDA